MRIVRNGVSYELTFEEMQRAYDEIDLYHFTEDIRQKLEEREIEDVSDEDIEDMAYNAMNGLAQNDNYYECYWMAVDDAIDEAIRDM